MENKKGIHLIKKDPLSHTDRVPAARLQKYGYVADIIVSNKEPNGMIYHYVIQPEGSRRIVHWGQELSFKRALDSVESFFEPYRVALRHA